MSHTIEYYQQMNTEQLIHEMNHAFWSIDRQRAAQVYRERMAKQRAKETTRNNQQSATMANQMRTLENTVNNLTHQNTRMAEVIRNQNNELQAMQTAHNNQVTAMRTDYNRRIKEVNDNNRAALQALETRMVNEDTKLRETIKDNFQRTTDMISAVNTNLTDRINAVHQDLSAQLQAQQEQINTLDQAFSALRHNDAQLRENAQEYLDAAVALINSTIEYNNSNRHSWRSSDLSGLINTRTHVEADLNSGMLAVGTARMQARDLFEDALRYRANVYADEREWQLRHASAQQRIDAAYADLEISRSFDVDGTELDVDYWTCGDLRRIGEQLEELELLLENPNLTSDELTGIGELAEIYRQEIHDAAAFAMQALQCSTDRKELLQIAIDHIESTVGNLHPRWEEYFANDNRLGYRVYLTAPETGEQVVLTAEPSKTNDGLRNQFRFDVLSTGFEIHNAQDAANFTNLLAETLSMVEGCVFTNPNCTNQATPASDNGQGDNCIWTQPNQQDLNAARQQATPSHTQHKPTPTPTNTFTPQAAI